MFSTADAAIDNKSSSRHTHNTQVMSRMERDTAFADVGGTCAAVGAVEFNLTKGTDLRAVDSNLTKRG